MRNWMNTLRKDIKMPTRSTVRAILRAVLVTATAFGLGWTAEQVAAVQLLAEALLQVAFREEK